MGSRTNRRVAALSVALALGVTAAGCGSSSKASTATTATTVGASSTTAAASNGAGGTLPPTSSDSAAAVPVAAGANPFCSKLENFPTQLEQALSGLTTSPASAVQAEYNEFKSLAQSAPSAISPQLLAVANYFETVEKDVSAGNTSALQGLEAQSTQLSTDGTQIGQWVAQNCG